MAHSVPATSNDGNWFLLPDFQQNSITGRCVVSGLMKRQGDPGVLRSHGLYDEYLGYYDISLYAIEQAAQMLGWGSPDLIENLKDEITDLTVQLAAARADAWKKAETAIKNAGQRALKLDA